MDLGGLLLLSYQVCLMYVHLVYIVWYVAHMRKKKKRNKKEKNIYVNERLGVNSFC